MFANALGAGAVLLPQYLQDLRAPRRVERRRRRAVELPAAQPASKTA
jgi:hypothetical protein